jgi:hypothetical protein
MQALPRDYSQNMAVFLAASLGFGILGFALITGCGGRASSRGLDGNAGGLASDGGNGAVSNPSGAAAGAVGGALSSVAAGGLPGSAGQSTPGDGAGGAARAGSPSTAGNGAGGAGAAGADSGLPEVTAACTKLCSGWIYGCNIWAFPPTCPNDCASDLAVQNGACTELGLSMLSCITATYGSTNNNLCYTVFAAGLAVCRAQVDAFRACAAGNAGSAPLPKICMTAGGPYSGGCSENFYCLNEKSYTFRCGEGPGGSSCACNGYDSRTRQNTSIDFTFDEPLDAVCRNHIAECVASVNPAP